MITIRTILPDDYEQVSHMIQETIKTSRNTYPQKLLKQFCNKYHPLLIKQRAETMHMRVAEEGNKILGCIALKNNQLKTFFVLLTEQGKGIGSKLYKHLENYAKKQCIKKLTLEGSYWGKAIYEHFGFIALYIIEKERLGIKYSDTYMEKIL